MTLLYGPHFFELIYRLIWLIKSPSSHLLLISIAALSDLGAEIPWELTSKRLPDVLRYIQWSNNVYELDDACVSLNYMVNRFLRQQLPIPKSVMDQVPYLIQYLTHSDHNVQRSSNRLLDTIASDSDEACQVLLNFNILDVLTKFLDDSGKCAQACRTISKFTAGNGRQIACVIEKGIMTDLIDIVMDLDSNLTTLERCFVGHCECIGWETFSRSISISRCPWSYRISV